MKIVVVGAGSHGAIVADAILRADESGAGLELTGFADDSPSATAPFGNIVVPIAQLATLQHDAIVVGIGDNATRRRVSEDLIAAGERFFSSVHPFSCIAPDTTIGDGTMISAGVVVGTRARIGRGVILNTRASVDHHNLIGDYAHISCGVTLGGDVVVGEETFIGLGASVSNGCRVGARTIIGAGAVVVRDIPDDVVAYGVPARVMRRR
jgi:acetyltransferase EpsM